MGEADNICHGMHATIGGLGAMAFVSVMADRQANAQRAQQAAAASGARVGVLRDTVADLRERLADEQHAHREDVADLELEIRFLTQDKASMSERMRKLEATVLELDRQRGLLADEVVRLRGKVA